MYRKEKPRHVLVALPGPRSRGIARKTHTVPPGFLYLEKKVKTRNHAIHTALLNHECTDSDIHKSLGPRNHCQLNNPSPSGISPRTNRSATKTLPREISRYGWSFHNSSEVPDRRSSRCVERGIGNKIAEMARGSSAKLWERQQNTPRPEETK